MFLNKYICVYDIHLFPFLHTPSRILRLVGFICVCACVFSSPPEWLVCAVISRRFGKWRVKQIYPSVKSKKCSLWAPGGCCLKSTTYQLSVGERIGWYIPVHRCLINYIFLLTLQPRLRSPEALRRSAMIVWQKCLLSLSVAISIACARQACLAPHPAPLRSLSPSPLVRPPFPASVPPPLPKMQYVPGNFSVHYLIVFCKYKVRLNYRWLYCLFVILLPCRATNEWAI